MLPISGYEFSLSFVLTKGEQDTSLREGCVHSANKRKMYNLQTSVDLLEVGLCVETQCGHSPLSLDEQIKHLLLQDTKAGMKEHLTP